MSLFSKKAPRAHNAAYPAEEYKPVIRQSICTGEKVACMRERASGHLQEIMLIRTPQDMEEFRARYGLEGEKIRDIY